MSFASLAAQLEPALITVIFLSLAFLGAGFFVKRAPLKHQLRIGGWVLFSLYWPWQAPTFFAEGDPVNAYFCLFAPLFILYMAYHEWKSMKWGEDPEALRWLTGTTFVAAVTYFLIYEVPVVQAGLIYFTAVQSEWMLELVFGVPAHTRSDWSTWGSITPETTGTHILLDNGVTTAGPEYAVTVILACTAIQSMMIFVGAIACLDADKRRKYRGYLYTVPIIYFLNLFRNAGIVYGYKILEWNPFGWGGPKPDAWTGLFWTDLRNPFTGEYAGLAQGSFEWMHSWIGKFGSLFALIIIALAVFSILPELHGNILDLFDLPKRKRAGFFNRDPPRPPKGEQVIAVKPPAPAGSPTAKPSSSIEGSGRE